ncbi:MAG: hypothetical protein JW993_18295 [Sedimentisphaerales bacterium]|nr:hypothetical protein [Sedimentisphaerales bacterium]
MADWKELDDLLKQEQQQQQAHANTVQQQRNAAEQNKQKAIGFVNDIALPAFRELEKGFKERNLPAHIERGEEGTSIRITVQRQGEGMTELKPFTYAIEVSYSANGIKPEVVSSVGRWSPQKVDRKLTASEIRIPIEKEDIIKDCLRAFVKTFALPA